MSCCIYLAYGYPLNYEDIVYLIKIGVIHNQYQKEEPNLWNAVQHIYFRNETGIPRNYIDNGHKSDKEQPHDAVKKYFSNDVANIINSFVCTFKEFENNTRSIKKEIFKSILYEYYDHNIGGDEIELIYCLEYPLWGVSFSNDYIILGKKIKMKERKAGKLSESMLLFDTESIKKKILELLPYISLDDIDHYIYTCDT